MMTHNSNSTEESFYEGRARSTLTRFERILLRTEVEAPIMRELAAFDFDSALSKVGQKPFERKSFENGLEEELLPYEPGLLGVAQQIDSLIAEFDYQVFVTVEQLFDVWRHTAVALPILAKYLNKPWQEELGARHIRFFAQKGGLAYWTILEDLFAETDPVARPFTKQSLAVALTEIAMSNKNAPTEALASFSLEESHGIVRKYFYRPLFQLRSQSQIASRAITQLEGDPSMHEYTILIPNGSWAQASLVPSANL